MAVNKSDKNLCLHSACQVSHDYIMSNLVQTQYLNEAMVGGLENPGTASHVTVVFRIVKTMYCAFFKEDS